jgi:hypothetical protein
MARLKLHLSELRLLTSTVSSTLRRRLTLIKLEHSSRRRDGRKLAPMRTELRR